MTAAMPLARPDDHGASPFAGADVCRLAGLRLLPGRRGPAFGDDVWDFTAVAGLPAQMQPSYRRWDFTAITIPAWRLVAREQLMALLAPRHEAVAALARASRTPLHLRTCQLRFAELVRLLNWLPAQQVLALGQLTTEHCQAYLVHRREIRGTDGHLAGQRSPSTALRAACAVTGLVSYRELFTADRPPAGLRPFGGASAARAAQLTQPAGNKTRPVPDDVLQPMLSAALYVTGTLGPHLTGLARQVHAAAAHRASLPGPASKTTPAAQLAAVVQSHLDRRVPLPRLPGRFLGRRLTLGWESDDPLLTVNLDAIAREAGAAYFPAGWLPAMRGQLEHAVRAVGAEASFGRDAAHVQHPGGSVPWTLPLDLHDSRDLIGMARTACLIVIAAISGMRASELMELTVSSPVPPQQLQPGLERYRLASLLVKGQPLGGTADEWVVIQPVHQAAELAAALLGDDIPKTSPLFGRFSFQPRYQAFRSWVNGPAGHRLGLAPIPASTVTPQALRRTLALQLAHRPGGLLAAKIHLKHVSVATTEGYAARPGGAQARLLAEINSEETERNLGLALAEFRNYQRGVMPAGPGARELTALFARIDTAVTTPAPGDVKIHNSDRDILNLLSKQAATLHLGIAIMLVHRPLPGPMPPARRHPHRQPAPRRNVRLSPLPASHPPPPPPRRVGQPRRRHQDLPRHARPHPDHRTLPPASRPRPCRPRHHRHRRRRLARRQPPGAHPMRLSPQQRHASETRIRQAMDRLLRGDLPPGGKCDIKTLAREAGLDRTSFYGTRPYTRLREEFENRLHAIRQAGNAPDPRDAQITRQKEEIKALRERIARHDTTIADLTSFKTAALSRIAAQHDEITRLRRDTNPASVRLLPTPSRRHGPPKTP